MRNLNRLTHAANRIQAREDYKWLVQLAQRANCVELIPTVRDDANLRTLDTAAEVGVQKLLRERPDLREVVRRVYPGWVGD